MKHIWKYLRVAFAVALLCSALFTAPPLRAAGSTVRVDSTADAPDADPGDGRCAALDGACTLRAAIMQANADRGPLTIELPAGVYMLTIANDDPAHDSAVRDLDISGDLTLRGVGPGTTIVQAGSQQGRGIDRTFEIHRGADARIENLGVRYGRAEDAGAIRVWGTLTLLNSFVTANESAAGGGGITNNGTLTLIDSAVTGNRARYGGGIVNFSRLTLRGSAVNANSAATDGGGIAASGEFTAVNSTISNNRAGGDGGGINVSRFTNSGRLFNVTVAQNVADSDANGSGDGGGIANRDNRTVTLRNTLVGENVDSGNEAPGCIGSLTSNNYNLLSGGGCTFEGESGDLWVYEPHLGGLQGDGPQTHSLLPDSPAIDAGDPAGCTDDAGAPLTTDQRKAPRPSGPRCDIGAFEANVSAPAPDFDARCFPETGYCISGRIREYWEQNGGLPVFGYPTSPQQPEWVEANIFQVQHFERNRLELHPENGRPYDVLLGRLGAEQVERLRIASPPDEPLASCIYFEQTQHMVCGEFTQAWQRDGLEFDGRPGKSFGESLALFGLPITGRMTMTLGDGKPYQVQYFERARFEYHPENAAPYNVLFGLLDNEARSGGAPPRP